MSNKQSLSLVSVNERELALKSLLDSLFKLDSNQNLTIDENSAIILTSWFNQPISITSPNVIFESYTETNQLKRLWYIIRTIENNQLSAYKINNYSLFIHKQSHTKLISILDIENLKCSTCGHFTHLEHACYHLLALYISISPNSPAPQPTTTIITHHSQIDL